MYSPFYSKSREQRQSRKNRRQMYNMLDISIINIALGFIILVIIIKAISWGFDKTFDNRDIMLCKSAIVSKNTVYLDKCDCYYRGEQITCIYEDKK